MPSSVLDLEQAYLTALQAVTTAQRDGDALTLTGPDLTLTFEPVPDVPTGRRSWAPPGDWSR